MSLKIQELGVIGGNNTGEYIPAEHTKPLPLVTAA